MDAGEIHAYAYILPLFDVAVLLLPSYSLSVLCVLCVRVFNTQTRIHLCLITRTHTYLYIFTIDAHDVWHHEEKEGECVRA